MSSGYKSIQVMTGVIDSETWATSFTYGQQWCMENVDIQEWCCEDKWLMKVLNKSGLFRVQIFSFLHEEDLLTFKLAME